MDRCSRILDCLVSLLGSEPPLHVDRQPVAGRCRSPKFRPDVKSTACEISSRSSPAITLVHVPLVLALVRSTCSRLSFAPKLASGESGTPTTSNQPTRPVRETD